MYPPSPEPANGRGAVRPVSAPAEPPLALVCASRFTQIVNQFILPLLYVSNAAVFVSSFLFIILGALPAVLCVAWMLCGCSRVRELYLKAMLCPIIRSL